MMTLVEKAPAKINLLLSVGQRRPDGYHDLASVMQTVDVCDTLPSPPTPAAASS